LIVGVDRLSRDLCQGDVLLLCSDGLYNVLDDNKFPEIIGKLDATSACRALIDTANSLGTIDNLTAAVVRILRAPVREQARPSLGERLRKLFRR
jgi:protein phosphatase